DHQRLCAAPACDGARIDRDRFKSFGKLGGARRQRARVSTPPSAPTDRHTCPVMLSKQELSPAESGVPRHPGGAGVRPAPRRGLPDEVRRGPDLEPWGLVHAGYNPCEYRPFDSTAGKRVIFRVTVFSAASCRGASARIAPT